MQVLNRMVWQLAIVPLVWFIPAGVMNSRGRLMWGFWLYAAVVLVMIFMQIRRRPRAPGIAPLIGGVLVVTFLSGCAPPGAKNWPFSIGPQTYAVALGDLDGDGDLDALVADTGSISIYRNDGQAGFAPK